MIACRKYTANKPIVDCFTKILEVLNDNKEQPLTAMDIVKKVYTVCLLYKTLLECHLFQQLCLKVVRFNHTCSFSGHTILSTQSSREECLRTFKET